MPDIVEAPPDHSTVSFKREAVIISCSDRRDIRQPVRDRYLPAMVRVPSVSISPSGDGTVAFKRKVVSNTSSDRRDVDQISRDI